MTARPPNEASRVWGNYAIRSLTPKDARPHSACPTCHGDAISPDTGQLLEFRCDRGHQWTQTRAQAEAHANWLARLFIGENTK